MTYYIKPEFVDVIINNTVVSFDGTKHYSQYQLSNMYRIPKYRNFISFHDDIHTESNIDINKDINTNVEYVKLVHPKNYKKEEETNQEHFLEDVELHKNYSELSLKELREIFPHIKATSKAKFLEQI